MTAVQTAPVHTQPQRSERAARRSAAETAVRTPRCVHATVARIADISPSLRRITLTGAGLAEFTGVGADQFVRLFLPKPGQATPLLPVTDEWWTELLEVPAADRPVLRNYTVRAWRADAGELDIDMVLHGESGPASRWAGAARVGDVVGILEQHAPYELPADAPWQLLAADETALPAIGAILETVPPGIPTTVLVEVPGIADVQPLALPPHVSVTWLPRGQAAAGSLLVDAVRGADLPESQGYAWVAGESSVVTTIRRHLVNDRKLRKERIYFCGYWRRDRPAYDE